MDDSKSTEAAPAAEVRRARRGDRARLGQLWQRLLEEQAAMERRLAPAADARERWENDFAHVLRDEAQRLFVAEAGEGVVGFAAARRWSAPPIYAEAHEVFVSELYVVPEARRRGVGQALVEAVKRWARAAGAERLRVAVLSANAAGRQFWQQAQGVEPLYQTGTIDLSPGETKRSPEAGRQPLGFR